MNASSQQIHIDRLDLDIRGVPAATVEAAMQALAPAMQLAIEQPAGSNGPTQAGVLHVAANVPAADLAQLVARRLAATLRRTPQSPTG